MFYVPVKDAKAWGAAAPNSQIFVAPHFNGNPEPVTELIVEVSEWSDGTPESDGTPPPTEHHH